MPTITSNIFFVLVPGMLALGASLENLLSPAEQQLHMKLAEQLLYTCVFLYKQQPIGIGPGTF